MPGDLYNADCKVGWANTTKDGALETSLQEIFHDTAPMLLGWFEAPMTAIDLGRRRNSRCRTLIVKQPAVGFMYSGPIGLL